jgi:enamine deaminase RidA (YjgF/YER057c/UK114 family)
MLATQRCTLAARPLAARTPPQPQHRAAPRAKTLRRTTTAMAAITRFEVGPRMSECSVFNGIIHLAGQVADDETADISGQTAQVLAAVDRLLAQAGSDKSRILMTQIYLKNIADFAAMNVVWEKWVQQGATPPRATVQATLANEKWLIEVVITAAAATPAAL